MILFSSKDLFPISRIISLKPFTFSSPFVQCFEPKQGAQCFLHIYNYSVLLGVSVGGHNGGGAAAQVGGG